MKDKGELKVELERDNAEEVHDFDYLEVVIEGIWQTRHRSQQKDYKDNEHMFCDDQYSYM